jgi:hypothetical protein
MLEPLCNSRPLRIGRCSDISWRMAEARDLLRQWELWQEEALQPVYVVIIASTADRYFGC